jgi:hypothetical protein
VLNWLSKQWDNCASWQIVKNIHNVVLNVPKGTILALSFLLILVDKVTTIDNLNWIPIHFYVVASWKWVPIRFMRK